ncbi:MAG: hypothetical protein ACO2OX_01720 [Candidatus Nanopusillus sp.]|jgi:hypothetical protein
MITLSELVKSVLDNYKKYASNENITFLSQVAEENPELFISDYLGIFYNLSNPNYVKTASDEYLTDLEKTFAEYNLALDELHERNPKLASDITDTIIDITNNVNVDDYQEIIEDILSQYSFIVQMGVELGDKLCGYLDQIGYSDISYKQILEYYSRILFAIASEFIAIPMMLLLSGVHERFEKEVGDNKIDDPEIDQMVSDYKDAIIETFEEVSPSQ